MDTTTLRGLTATKVGSDLISYSIKGTVSQKPVTFKVSSDTIECSGKNVLLKGCPSGGEVGSTYYLTAQYENGSYLSSQDLGNGLEFIANDNIVGIYIGIDYPTGTNVDITFTPQLYFCDTLLGNVNTAIESLITRIEALEKN